MRNPTIVVLADRNDLHNQLFVRFSRFHDLLRQSVMEAESRAHLRRLPLVQAGGVIVTTLQRFFPRIGATCIRHILSDGTLWSSLAKRTGAGTTSLTLARANAGHAAHGLLIGFTGTSI